MWSTASELGLSAKRAKDWRLQLPLIRSRKYMSINTTDSACCGGPDEKISPAPGIDQIAWFVEFRLLRNWEKDNFEYVFIFHKLRKCEIKNTSKFALKIFILLCMNGKSETISYSRNFEVIKVNASQNRWWKKFFHSDINVEYTQSQLKLVMWPFGIFLMRSLIF